MSADAILTPGFCARLGDGLPVELEGANDGLIVTVDNGKVIEGSRDGFKVGLSVEITVSVAV